MNDRARVVFDTNVLVSALLVPNSIALRCYGLAEQNCALITSQALLRELAEVLKRPKFERYFDEWTRLRFIARVQANASAIVPDPDVRMARDQKDDIVLATAKAGQAHFIVTGDDDLLSLSTFAGARIVQPAAFLERLEAPRR